ncbi:MAG: hypothetical protein LQ346_007059 [Caloplaca aetnensis]|nr:MAG: hypothetical protein LQ346_007059 [Caloplaca aetnensis]
MRDLEGNKGNAGREKDQTDNVESCPLYAEGVGEDINVTIDDRLRFEQFWVLVVDVPVAAEDQHDQQRTPRLVCTYLFEMTIFVTKASCKSSKIRSTTADEQVSIEEVLLHTLAASAAVLNLHASSGVFPGNESL